MRGSKTVDLLPIEETMSPDDLAKNGRRLSQIMLAICWEKPMGSEDFAYMLEACSGAFINIGIGDTGGPIREVRAMISMMRHCRLV
jgi:metal-dependent amidase/aminoacylase/carboxypeptidase family protein